MKVHAILLLLVFFGIAIGRALAQEATDYDITDFGAEGDGTSLNTVVLQRVIDEASQNGGGRVIIPSGIFLIGTVELKSGVELHLQAGATLLGSTNPFHYRSLEMKGRPVSPKQDDNSQLALLVAYQVENVAITGPGNVDGQGRALALNIDSLHHAGIVVDPDYSTATQRPNEKMRPKLLRFSMGRQVTLRGGTFKNAACWGLSFELCEQLILDSLTIYNRAYWNNDGIDVTDCRQVQISNCTIDAADDAICLKSYYPDYTNDLITIRDCDIISGASAIKLGTASYGGFRNLLVENIRITDTYRSAIAIECVDGGIIENLSFRHITATNTGNAIFIRLGHRGGATPGAIRNVQISDVKVQVPFGRPDIDYDLRAMEAPTHHNPIPSSITGLPGHRVENVILRDIEITLPGRATRGQAYVPLWRLGAIPELANSYPEFSMFGELPAWAFYVRHVSGLLLQNVDVKLETQDFRPAFVFDDVAALRLRQIRLPEKLDAPQIVLRNSSQTVVNPALVSLTREVD